MTPRFLRNIVLVTAVSLGAAACNDGYGYGGVSYGSGYYDGYGPSYASPSYGWYDGWYYPGNGYYVYDNRGKRQRWNDSHRRYWESRRGDGRRDWNRRDRDRRDWDRRDWDRRDRDRYRR